VLPSELFSYVGCAVHIDARIFRMSLAKSVAAIVACCLLVTLLLALSLPHDEPSVQPVQRSIDERERDATTLTHLDVEKLIQTGSSMRCSGSSHDDRRCSARNLCFDTREKMFVTLAPNRSWEGIPPRPFTHPFADLTAIYDHNIQHMTFVDITPEMMRKYESIVLLKGTSLLFRRFNPSNVFHGITTAPSLMRFLIFSAFHDDLLPLFVTLQEIGRPRFDEKIDTSIRLVHFEERDQGEHYAMLRMLSDKVMILPLHFTHTTQEPVSSRDFPPGLVCFEHAFFGMSKASLW
jgi:hypothetical protein